MNRLKSVFLCLITLCLCYLLQAQSSQCYDVTSGLSSNSIKGIIQDDRGYIWIATSDGLNVFNSNDFKAYGHSYAPPSMNENKVVLNLMTILLHKDGKKIWAGAQSDKLHLFDPDNDTFTAIDLTMNGSTPSPNLCYCITYDPFGRLWVGTDQGIFIYDEEHNKMEHHFHNSDNNIPDNTISSILCDSNGTMWVGTAKGLIKYNYAANEFIPIKIDKKGFGCQYIHITSITEGKSDDLWIGTWDRGLAVLGKKNNILRPVRMRGDNEYASTMRVRNTLFDENGLLWICTNFGLFKFDFTHNQLASVILSANNPNDNIYSIFMDKERGIWVGSMFQGLYYLAPRARQIECYTQDNVRGHLNGSAISSFLEDDNGHIYIGSENGGLSLFAPDAGKFLKHNHNIPESNIHALCKDDNTLFVGTYGHGLRCINLNTGKSESLKRRNSPELPSDNIFSLYKGNTGKIYIGTDEGCAIYDTSNGNVKEIDELENLFIYCITEDEKENIWFASYYAGVYRYNKKEDIWKQYVYDLENPGSLPGNKATGIYLDDSGALWVCTAGEGLCRYDYESDKFEKFVLTDNGKDIPLSKISGIQNDANGKLWISSSRGIYVCGSDGKIIRYLTHEDGLQSNQFCTNAIFRSQSGNIYFGGVNGFNIINPDDLTTLSTSFTVTASILYGTDENVVRTPVVSDFGNVTLPREISSFSMDFECLSYMAPRKNRFAYKIDDSDWTYTGSTSANFINFPYGKHTITVKGCNGDGLWNENEVSVKINNLPPVQKSFIAKCLYIILIIALIIVILLLTEKRNSEKNNMELKRIKAEQQQEAYKAKIDFFTHVAHEIKTPVTLIKAPLDMILQNQNEGKDLANLEIMSRNTDRLLNLVNQLLDFKKISSDGHDICLKASDPALLIEQVVNRFDIAVLGDIKITKKLPREAVHCMLDPEAYTKIISNLVTNAVKHARSRIEVILEVRLSNNGHDLHLEVSDDGPGIPEKDRKKIFESFYQINTENNPRISGVGLGLSLVKLLVQKHNGKAYIDDSHSSGCCICIDIPYIASNLTKEDKSPEGNIPTQPVTSGDIPENSILIVEDTVDMLDFISGIFADNHQIYKAANGKIALEILSQHDIDIIITDVSMPVMNGFEFLQEIRKNDMYCHIPVIMLTVESALENKIRGLEYGADAYIEKPFSATHLIAKVNNLIERRDAMRKQYAGNQLQGTSIVMSRDQKWMEHLYSFINDNIQEPEITIEMLANELNMSRSSFQRKLKGLTGLTPIELVRLTRLNKAADLLTSGEYRINEIAYMVGFNKPSYFSSLFKKQFGVLPKDYKQNTTQ